MHVAIDSQSFEVIPLLAADQATYRAYCVFLARRADRPIERFFRTQCPNLSREERQDALAAWMQTPGWDEPPEELVLQWARHPKAVAALARRVLRPEKTQAEWERIIGAASEAVYASLVSALQTIVNPSDDHIRQSNQALREALARPAVEDSAKQPAPQGADACAPAAEVA